MRTYILIVAVLIMATLPALAAREYRLNQPTVAAPAGESQQVMTPITDDMVEMQARVREDQRKFFARAKDQLKEADGDCRRAAKAEICGKHQEAVRLQRIAVTKVYRVREELGPERFAKLLREYGGPASSWAASSINSAKERGLIVGSSADFGPNSQECQAPLSVERASAAFLRHDQNVNAHPEAFADHNQDPDAHSGLVEQLRKDIAAAGLLGTIAFWALVALLAILLLRRLFRRRAVAVVGVPALGAVPPFAPGPAVAPAPVAPAPFTPFSRDVSRRVLM